MWETWSLWLIRVGLHFPLLWGLRGKKYKADCLCMQEMFLRRSAALLVSSLSDHETVKDTTELCKGCSVWPGCTSGLGKKRKRKQAACVQNNHANKCKWLPGKTCFVLWLTSLYTYHSYILNGCPHLKLVGIGEDMVSLYEGLPVEKMEDGILCTE